MKKLILLSIVGILLTSCTAMIPINNYPGAIVTDKEKVKWNGRLIVIKYVEPRHGKWVYKKLWISNWEYQNLKSGDTLR